MLTNSDEQSAGLSVAQVVELLDAVAGEPEDDAANVFERLSSELPAGEAAGLVDRLRDLRS
ncbi:MULTISPECIES: hypothetical protein, partial [unclassified Saccharopolyspora]|uniref:hypothetical protein n=1 Tax=unclassified Saccharopolyspora TaxID=2646250 RepID=UPI001CD1B4F4